MFFGLLPECPFALGSSKNLGFLWHLSKYMRGGGTIFMFVPRSLISSLYVLKHFIRVFNHQEEEIFGDSRAEASGRKIILEENKKQTDACMGKDIMYAWLICIYTDFQSLFMRIGLFLQLSRDFACTTHFCLKGVLF